MGTSIANREHLPLVPVRFVPVDASTPKVPVDLQVRWTADLAPILDARRLDATQYCVKLLFRDTEAEVVDWKRLICIYEVKRQAIVYEDRGKRSNGNRGPFNPKQFGKQSRGSDFVARRNDGVIKVHCYVTPHAQDRRSGSMASANRTERSHDPSWLPPQAVVGERDPFAGGILPLHFHRTRFRRPVPLKRISLSLGFCMKNG